LARLSARLNMGFRFDTLFFIDLIFYCPKQNIPKYWYNSVIILYHLILFEKLAS